MKYYCTDGQEMEEIEEPTAEEAAQKYVDTGDWGEVKETFWVDVAVSEKLGDDGCLVDAENFLITVDPEEPECTEEEHDWQSPLEVVGGHDLNPGVWGHEGGVRIHEVCKYCGYYRITDTWAQDPDTGVQGLESIEYKDPDEESLNWIKGNA